MTVVRLLYTTAIHFYSLGVRIAACLGHAKAKQWVDGRKVQRTLSQSKGPNNGFGFMRPRSASLSKADPSSRH